MGDFRFLQYERTGDLVRIASNRPPFNVLDIPAMAEMNLALERAAGESGAKVLMLTGVGEKAFSAGVDVADYTKRDAGSLGAPVCRRFARRRTDLPERPDGDRRCDRRSERVHGKTQTGLE